MPKNEAVIREIPKLGEIPAEAGLRHFLKAVASSCLRQLTPPALHLLFREPTTCSIKCVKTVKTR